VADGTATVADTVTFDAKTVLTRTMGISPETLSPAFSRNPQPLWTVNPIADPKGLIASWHALRWVTVGPPEAGSAGEKMLRLFHVDGVLAGLSSGWLHIGCRADVPHCAAYSAHCGNTWVWVNPEDMAGLSAFTLVVLDIGTTDTTSLNDGFGEDGRRTANVKVEVSAGTDAGNKISVALDKQTARQTPNPEPGVRFANPNAIEVSLDGFPTGFGFPQTVSFVPPNGGPVNSAWQPLVRRILPFGLPSYTTPDPTKALPALPPNPSPRKDINWNK
jgi:hypothetical protein